MILLVPFLSIFRTEKMRAIARSRRELSKTPLEVTIDSVGVKWQGCKVGYLSEKSMRILKSIDFLPEMIAFSKQNGEI